MQLRSKIIKLFKIGFLALVLQLTVSTSHAQYFGTGPIAIVTTPDCNSRHEGSVRAVLDVRALPSSVGPEQRVALYRIESDGRFHHSYYDDETQVGYVFERLDLLARDYKLRWYYDENCYVEVPFTISDTPPIEAELHVEQSTEGAACQDGRAYLTINRTPDEQYTTRWSNGYQAVSLVGLQFDARNPEFSAGNWHVSLYGSEGCDANLRSGSESDEVAHYPIAEFDFTIDCCIKNPTPPSIRYVTHPTNCDSSNGGFSVFGGAPPANNLGIDAFEWIVTDVYGNWVPPTDGESGPNYDGLPAGDYTFEAITDEMYDDDVFEGCEMPTSTFTLGEGEQVDFLVVRNPITCQGEDSGVLELDILGPAGLEVVSNSTGTIDVFTVIGQDGDQVLYQYIASGLPLGDHRVVVGQPDGGCSREFSVQVRLLQSNLANIRSVITDDCGGAGSGKVQLVGFPQGFNEFGEVLWADGSTNRYLTSLEAGEHCYTVTYLCGLTLSACAVVGDPADAFTYDLAPECDKTFDGEGVHDVGRFEIVPTGGPTPTFIGDLSSGQPSRFISHEQSRLGVTFGDESQPCTRMISTEVPLREVEMTTQQPCFENDGMLTLNIRVEPSDVVKAFVGFYQSPTEVDLINSSPGVYSYTKTGIGQGLDRVFLTINGCKFTFEESFQLGSGRELNYVSYDGVLCEFEQICGLDTVPNAPYYTSPTFDYETMEVPWLGRFRVDAFCGDTSVDPLKMNNKTVSKFVFQELYRQAEAAQIPYLYPKGQVGDGKYFDDTDMCDLIEYCPITMHPHNRYPRPGNASGTYVQEDGCIRSTCGVFFNTVCPEDGYLPPGVDFDSDAAIRAFQVNHCAVREISIADLMTWHSELLTVESYQNSTLAEEASRLIDLHGSSPAGGAYFGTYCAIVRYCEGSYSHISTEELNALDLCGQLIPIAGCDPSGTDLENLCPNMCEFYGDEGDCRSGYVYCPRLVTTGPTCTGCPPYQPVRTVVSSCAPISGRQGVAWPGTPLGELSPVSIRIPELYAPHKGKGFVNYYDEEGLKLPPIGFTKSPFRTGVDIRPYDDILAYDEYRNLMALDLSLSPEIGTYALQQDAKNQVRGEMKGTEVLSAFVLVSDDSEGRFAVGGTICDAKDCYSLIESDSDFQFFSASSEEQIDYKKGVYLLSASRSESNGARMIELTMKSSVTEVSLSLTPQQLLIENNEVSTLVNRVGGELELVEVEKLHEGKALASAYLGGEYGAYVSVYTVQESGMHSFQIQEFSDDSFEAVGEHFTLDIESSNSAGSLVKPISTDKGQYGIIAAGTISISVFDADFSTSADNVYLIHNGVDSDDQENVQAIAVLDGCEVVDVYEKEVDGWIYLQIEVPGQLDGGTGLASVNGYPIFNEGLYSQVVIVPIQLPTTENNLSKRSNQSKEDDSRKLASGAFSVYPNPSSGNLFANIPSFDGCAGEVRILSSRGDEVISQAVEVESDSRLEFSLDQFPSGLYFAHYLNDCGESQAVRFVLR